MSKSAAEFHTEVCRLWAGHFIESIKVILVFVSLYLTLQNAKTAKRESSLRGSFSVRRHFWWNVVVSTSFLPIFCWPASCIFTWIADFLWWFQPAAREEAARLRCSSGEGTIQKTSKPYPSCPYDKTEQLFGFFLTSFCFSSGILKVWIYVYYMLNTHSVRLNI